MTYTPNIPVSGESLGSTRDPIRTNFQKIDSVNSINHVAFNSSGAGKHKFLQMPEQGSAPTTAVDEGALYTKVGVGPAEAALFYRGESDGNEYQLVRADSTKIAVFATNTEYRASSSSTVPALNGGWTFLPGGMLFQYGYLIVAKKDSTTTVEFPKNFTNTPYSITIGSVTTESGPSANNQFIKQGTVTTSGFSVVNSSGSSARSIYWQAIGV